MSSSSRGAKPGTGSTKQKPQNRTAPPRLNRAQLQAMEIRSAATVIDAESAATTAGLTESGARSVRRSTSIASPKKIISRPVLLTRAQEYRYIRADMRRLILTAVALFALMIVILFIVER